MTWRPTSESVAAAHAAEVRGAWYDAVAAYDEAIGAANSTQAASVATWRAARLVAITKSHDRRFPPS